MWKGLDGTELMRADGSGPDETLVGIRPEDISLVPGGESASDGIVRIVEYIGPTTTLLIEWAGTQVHVVAPRRAAFRPGDRVRLSINAARAVLFDVAHASLVAGVRHARKFGNDVGT
jgi:ABC-type sugar transport system ATPase subunit